MRKAIHKVKNRFSKKKPTSTALATTEKETKITNSTVAEHREEVLTKARKFRYPHIQPRHRIVYISVGLALISLVTVFTWSLVLLYKQQSTSGYAYQFSRFFPVPVARVDGSFVSYESYLFELRHNIHYKRTQENVDFNSREGKEQLQGLRDQALEKVINDQYIAKKARENGLFVTGEEIDNEIKSLQQRNELGANREVLEGVLQRYYDWGFEDFRRSIYIQLVRQKYLGFLEKDKMTQAQDIVNQARGGTDFATLVKQYSNDDSTKETGGQWPPITKDQRELPQKVVDTAFSLKPGDVSDPIETPYGIEILKIQENNGTEVKAQHIVINYRNLYEIVSKERESLKTSKYIKF